MKNRLVKHAPKMSPLTNVAHGKHIYHLEEYYYIHIINLGSTNIHPQFKFFLPNFGVF